MKGRYLGSGVPRLICSERDQGSSPSSSDLPNGPKPGLKDPPLTKEVAPLGPSDDHPGTQVLSISKRTKVLPGSVDPKFRLQIALVLRNQKHCLPFKPIPSLHFQPYLELLPYLPLFSYLLFICIHCICSFLNLRCSSPPPSCPWEN